MFTRVATRASESHELPVLARQTCRLKHHPRHAAGGPLHLMLLTRDPALVAAVSDFSGDCEIPVDTVQHAYDASACLERAKFEGVMLDCDSVSGAADVLVSLLASRSNRNAVVVTVATGTVSPEFKKHSHFILQRPLKPTFMRKTFAVVHSLMQREFRRYFRASVQLPFVLQRHSGERLHCTTTNLSRTGVALTSPRPLDPGEEVNFDCVLPGGTSLSGRGEVIWDDKHGKSGLRLCCRTPQMRQELEAWLDGIASEMKASTP